MNKYPTYPPKLFITIYEHASPCTTTSTTPRYAKQSWPRLGFPPSYFLCQPTESHLFSWDTDHHNLHREQKLGYDHSRCRFSEFEIRKLGNRPVQWDWMEKCLFGASYRRWRFPESLWLKCQSLHFEQLAKKHPSFSQLYCQIFFLVWLSQSNDSDYHDCSLYLERLRVLKGGHGLKWNMLLHNCSVLSVTAFTFTFYMRLPDA